MNGTNDNEAYSFYFGGVNASFANGAVHFLSEHMAAAVFAALATKASSDLAGDLRQQSPLAVFGFGPTFVVSLQFPVSSRQGMDFAQALCNACSYRPTHDSEFLVASRSARSRSK